MNFDLKKIPSTPGVYKFYSNNKIIYIGKAKNLKKRVSSYFGNTLKDRKTNQIKKLTDNIETFTTKNEVEALLLEQMLIKENKPKFNILLRDDKTYPYIYFSLDHKYPAIYLKRTKKAVDIKYFGPFISSEAVKKSIKEIQKIFQLRNCSDSSFKSRTRPCIEYQMKRCSAPCVGKINKIDYFEDVNNAQSYLSSKDSLLVDRLKTEINKAVKKLDFEKAAVVRDRLKRLNILREEQSIVTRAKDVDIFSAINQDTYIGICIIVVRNGKVRGTKTHLVKQAHYDDVDNIYQSVILNFYEFQPDIPNRILCSNQLSSKTILQKVLKKKLNKEIRIFHTPNKAIKPIYKLCKINAKQVIENHLSKEEKYSISFNGLTDVINTAGNIKKIEAYDISHISGDYAVASCVVFSRRGPQKKEYRLFNIPGKLAGNDIGSLEHVLYRRLKYFADKSVKPDLILIDGGEKQLKFSKAVIESSEYSDIKVISIVKGFNRIRATETILSSDGVIEFDKYSKSYLLLQEIRDEAHRFAISAQRKKKNKLTRKSKLDNVYGIGSELKNRLIKKFKNVRIIKTLKVEDLILVKGINKNLANRILKELKG